MFTIQGLQKTTPNAKSEIAPTRGKMYFLVTGFRFKAPECEFPVRA